MNLGQSQSDSFPANGSLAQNCCFSVSLAHFVRHILTKWKFQVLHPSVALQRSSAAGQKRALLVCTKYGQTYLTHLGRVIGARDSASLWGPRTTVGKASAPPMPDEIC